MCTLHTPIVLYIYSYACACVYIYIYILEWTRTQPRTDLVETEVYWPMSKVVMIVCFGHYMRTHLRPHVRKLLSGVDLSSE